MENKNKYYQVISENGIHYYHDNGDKVLHIFYNVVDDIFLINTLSDNELKIAIKVDEKDGFQVDTIEKKHFSEALLDALISFNVENYIS